MLRIERGSYLTMPWKNGAGITTQIAAYPADATTESFEWRISMAAVTADGPFSAFPDVERTLAILKGAGINLVIAGLKQHLTRASAPFTFPADAAAHATLIDGDILDLNVMTRRNCFSHSLRKFSRATTIPVSGTVNIVFAQSAGLLIDDGNQSNWLLLGDTAIFGDAPKSLSISTEGSGDYYLIELTRLR